MSKSHKQMAFFPRAEKSYGGVLLNRRKARACGRPLSTRNTMHLVLRSTKAVGVFSFLRKDHSAKIQTILRKFSDRYAVRLISVANVGNHIHIHLKLRTVLTYRAFIRAVTAAIAMAVTKVSRICCLRDKGIKKFWDYRPFTRIVASLRAFLNLRDYLKINELEGQGYNRSQAQALVWMKSGRWLSS